MTGSVVSCSAQHVSMVSDEAKASKLGALCTELMKMKEYLVEVEQNKELVDNEQVQSLLSELGRTAYEVEDVVDTFLINSKRLFKWPRTCKASKQLSRLRLQMEEVKCKLDKYKQLPTESNKELRSWTQGSEPSNDHIDDDCVVGIDGNVNRLIKLLTRKFNDDQPPLDVLAIMGMLGSGKTTLTRKIYNHQVVKKHFKCRAWVTLSQGWEWEASAVMIDILSQATGNKKNRKGSAHTIEGHSHDLLRGKTCLVVLDNVWDLKSLYQILSMLIPHESSAGVKVIFTSRKHVPSLDSHICWSFHETQRLDEEDSWKLLSKLSSKCGKEYKALAMEMLKKCEGLPLAIVALGNFLKTKDTIQEWKRVLSKTYQPVNCFLGFNYDDLPYHLKPCFLYLGLFPKGSIISAGTLTRLWIAEGFVHLCQDEETMEDIARMYLQELISHTMVQVVSKSYSGKVKAIRVHHMMRAFCIMKARDLDFLTTFPSHSEAMSMHSRRAAVNRSMCLNLPIQNSHLRSLLMFGKSSTDLGGCEYASKGNKPALNLAPVCEFLKLLRVLDISGIKTSDGTMPTQIGSLIHLRFLRIRSTNIQELPKSIGKLCNLFTLDYWDISVANEIKLPNVLWKLKRLRHLYLPNEMGSKEKDLKLHTIKDLQTLWGVRGGNWMLRGMKNFSPTLKKLFIQGISSREQLEAVFNCSVVKTYDHLYALALDWYGFDLDSLDALYSKPRLQKLRLMGKTHATDKSKPLKFPLNLQKLELYFTRIEATDTMGALGQLHQLKFLTLSRDSFIGSEWTCLKEGFPKLEELKLSNLPKLEEWKMERGTMPYLKKLSIASCIKLERMPEGVRFMYRLEKLEIENMPHSFCSRLLQVKEQKATTREGEDFHIIQHIPCIRIHVSYSQLS